MELALRRKAYRTGGWWGRGMGQSGETDEEGTGLPTDSTPDTTYIDYSSGEVDPSTLPGPGYNIPTKPGAELSDAELAAEQARARDFLAKLPNILNTATKVTMSAAQLAAGLTAGVVKPSTTCPGGYLVAGTGQCVQTPAAAATAPTLVAGIPNSTLFMIIGGFGLLLILSKSGGRR